MSLLNLLKRQVTQNFSGYYVQQQEKAGVLVTSELDNALAEVTTKVSRISKQCRLKNRKFRDTEFDLENDRERCLHGISGTSEETFNPSDVQRVTEIFDNPQFFIDGADSNDIVQGAIGDCWFVSALATLSTAEGLVEKFCVARDEEIGVYGFIFFHDGSWQTVIIDDLLYTSIPKFEELSAAEKQLYHNDKIKYNESARKGSKSLFFGKSGTQGETWVPLIEKAYAKLHGSYAALTGGEACEAIEDLTGGVSSFIPSRDILDVDKFWREELLKANNDRLFGCAYDALNSSRSGDWNAKVNGLISNHAYSVLRAVEVNGKRFVVVRNPWGESEWTGPWSDGSKEWTAEWLAALPLIGHSFGDDGQFVMAYEDFLSCWQQIDRTLLFDSSWVMSYQWLHVQARPLPSAWTYGDVSFTISIPKTSPAIIVLSQMDERYFNPISGRSHWTFDFMVFKKGEKEPLAGSSLSRLYARSVNLELDLEAGDYVVHVRLDRRVYRERGYYDMNSSSWDQRQLSRMLTARASAQAAAINFKTESEAKNLPFPLEVLAGQDLSELEKKAQAIIDEKKKAAKAAAKKKAKEEEEKKKKAEAEAAEKARKAEEAAKQKEAEKTENANGSAPQTESAVTPSSADDTKEDKDEEDEEDKEEKEDPQRDIHEVSEDDSIFLGLRVYTSKDAPAAISGQLRHEMEMTEKLAL